MQRQLMQQSPIQTSNHIMAGPHFDPERDEPGNGTHRQIKAVYDRLVEAGHEQDATALRSDRRDVGFKLRKARQLEEEHFAPASVEEKTRDALEDIESDEQRQEVKGLLARAETFDPIDDEHADGLRAEAFALAAHGEPEAHVDALGADERTHAEEFLARAETMRGIDPDVHEELKGRAVDTIEPAVQSAYGDADDVTEHVIERDVEATVDAVRSDIIGDDV